MQRSLIATMVAACLALTLSARAEDKPADKYPDVSVNELKSAIEKNKVVVIDVNGSDSFKQGHIPGAIDFEANAEKLDKVLPRDKDTLIVAYCGGPQCQAYKSAAQKAVAMGYKNVKHLSAGISGWKSAGEKVEKGEGKAS